MKPAAAMFLLAALPFLAATACTDPVSDPLTEGDPDLQVGNTLLDSQSEVTLRAEGGPFVAGGPVTLVLQNGSSEQLGHNLCFHGLERRSGSSWELLPDGRVCTAHLNVLAAGATASYQASLPAGLQAGEYRFRVALYLMEGQDTRDQVSQVIQVGG